MTTPPLNDPETLRHILANTKALLLDFDGPICSVFAGTPALAIADQLRHVLTDGGHNLPEHIQATGDPFDVLNYAATLGSEEVRYVEATFTAHEIDAIATATPTPGAHRLIHSWHNTGRPLAIVSNNSVAAVSAYVQLHRLDQVVSNISARTPSRTALLKPNPYLITQAASKLGMETAACTMIGDSPADIQAAHSAGSQIIAFAKNAEKRARLTTAKPAEIVQSISIVIDAISD
jgi:HAD superfamily hydrolase (TIGR01509 family)